MTKNNELFNQCLIAWRHYQDTFGATITDDIEAYDFSDELDLLFINLRLLKNINIESISSLESYYKSKSIFFNALTENRDEVEKKLIDLNLDYKVSESMGFNIWTKPIECPELGHFELKAGRIDSDLFEEYKDITHELFESTDDTIPNLNKKFLTTKELDHEVIILKDGEKAVATACYCVVNGTVWMFGGSVFPEYREKGVWKYLIKLRQQRSKKFGGNFWFIQTVNKLIEGKCDEFLSLDCWKKV